MVKLNLKAVKERVAALGGRESYDRELVFSLLPPHTESSISLRPQALSRAIA